VLLVRPAVAEDAPAIARVHVETWQATYRGIVPQDFLDALNIPDRTALWTRQIGESDAAILVSENGDGLCGFISGGRLRDGAIVAEMGYDAEIYTLYVLPSAQGQGAGRSLMQALAGHLAGSGLRRPVVWALEENPWCAFYERLGGRRVAQKMIEIGGKSLSDIAYGWDDLAEIG